MSSTTANSSARKRRATKNSEPIKPNMQKQTV